MKRLILLFATACVMPLGAVEKPLIREGERFPVIALPGVSDGVMMSIESFRGQRLMLHIFASW